MQTASPKQTSWLDRPVAASLQLDWSKLIFGLIVLLAVITRFYKLEPRVMSHDENSHVYYSWLLYQGFGYQHDPVTHGPFQFHVVALSYFIFGDSDTTARLPAVLFGIATVAFMWNYRRYLGKAGAILAALFFTISPYMLYYSRYVRNESFVAFFGVVTLWAILRYLESGEDKYMIWLSAAASLQFCTKETAYIYTAQVLLFAGLLFVRNITLKPWKTPTSRWVFLGTSLFSVLFMVIGGVLLMSRKDAAGVLTQNQAPVNQPAAQAIQTTPTSVIIVFLALGLLLLIVAIAMLWIGYGWQAIKRERSFDIILVQGTLVLPLLAAFPLKAIGLPVPTNATSVMTLSWQPTLQMSVVVILIMGLAVWLGTRWHAKRWLINTAVFYTIFVFFYTTYFTNLNGFFTGLLGSLSYWMAQQAVNRGTQPWFYYLFLQIPIYEFLPVLGSLVAGWIYLRWPKPAAAASPAGEGDATDAPADTEFPVFGLLAFWSLSSLVAYTYAGEKMPWLTVHITLAFLILAGWGLGRVVDSIDWGVYRNRRGLPATLLVLIATLSLTVLLGILLSTTPPLHGKSTLELRATGAFVLAVAIFLASLWGIRKLSADWAHGQVKRLTTLVVFGILAVLTARAAFRASYVNYDRPLEYLVYAHSATGVKTVLSQIEDISRRTTDGLDLKVAIDNETTYPYWWYLRDYPNHFEYGANPSYNLRDYPVILVGDANYSKVESIVRNKYFQYDYMRLWWPNEEYKRITWERVDGEYKQDWLAKNKTGTAPAMKVSDYLVTTWKRHIRPFFTDARVREAVWQVWFDRQYDKYASLSGSTSLTLPTWSPGARMRMYIRKDLAAQLWDYNVLNPVIEKDPYEGKSIELKPDRVITAPGDVAFKVPHGLAMAPDGSLYVLDTGNNRVVQLDPNGQVLQTWALPPGEQNDASYTEPWGIAVGADGLVYIADTWYHRILKLSPDGQLITSWGKANFDNANDLAGFYGPRGLAVDQWNHVLVTDTGHNRVVAFDQNGTPLSQFGSLGGAIGQFAEPVGVTIGPDGKLYIADTWNKRIQIYAPSADGAYTAMTVWDLNAWDTTSITNKPYLAVGANGHVFASDPDNHRILEFDANGQIVRWWGLYGSDEASLNAPTGLAVDAQGGIWVADTVNNRILHFTLPNQ